MNKYLLCIQNTANPASLILGKVYRQLPDSQSELYNFVRVLDEDDTEPDGYLYPATMFTPIELPEAAEQALMSIYA